MRRLFAILLAVLCSAWIASGQSTWTQRHVYGYTNLVYAAAPVGALVQSIIVQADAPVSTVTFYEQVSSPVSPTNMVPAGTNFITIPTNNFTPGNMVLIVNRTNDFYQSATVHTTTTGGIQITNTGPPSVVTIQDIQTNDLVYQMYPVYNRVLGSNSLNLASMSGVWKAPTNSPFLIRVTGGAAPSTNTTIFISGR